MRLYSRTGQTVLNDAEYGVFEAGPDGGFDLPEDLAEREHAFHVGGRPLWETDVERQYRLAAEELDRRRDPATLMNAVQQLVNAAAVVAPQPQPEVPAPGSKTTRTRKSAASSTPPAE